MDKVIKFGAIFEGAATRKDKGLVVRLGTNELSQEIAGWLLTRQNAFVYVALKEEDFGQEEIEAIEAMEADAMDDHRKTRSQQLRSVLWLNWKQDDKGCKTFALYYDIEMERITEHFKKKLP